MNKKIYKGNIVNALNSLANRHHQERIWLNQYNPRGLVDSFIEAANTLFDDCVVGDYLEEGEILFDRATTNAFKELDAAVDSVDEFRSEEDIINDPLMEIVRQKAAKALALIEASNGRESTVEIID
jgi:hypothetical protein